MNFSENLRALREKNGMTQEQLIEMYILAFALAALAYWKHRENIGRLIHGNERKTYLFKKNKPEN